MVPKTARTVGVSDFHAGSAAKDVSVIILNSLIKASFIAFLLHMYEYLAPAQTSKRMHSDSCSYRVPSRGLPAFCELESFAI